MISLQARCNNYTKFTNNKTKKHPKILVYRIDSLHNVKHHIGIFPFFNTDITIISSQYKSQSSILFENRIFLYKSWHPWRKGPKRIRIISRNGWRGRERVNVPVFGSWFWLFPSAPFLFTWCVYRMMRVLMWVFEELIVSELGFMSDGCWVNI